LRQRLEQESAALAALAQPERLDESALTAQLDKVLDLERELKHLHTSALVQVKNLLTDEQQTRLHGLLKSGAAANDVRERLGQKLEQVQAGVQKWQAGGRDPAAIAQTLSSKVQPMLRAGKIEEAEAELDRLLDELNK
jgi:hypothetical protein